MRPVNWADLVLSIAAIASLTLGIVTHDREYFDMAIFFALVRMWE